MLIHAILIIHHVSSFTIDIKESQFQRLEIFMGNGNTHSTFRIWNEELNSTFTMDINLLIFQRKQYNPWSNYKLRDMLKFNSIACWVSTFPLQLVFHWISTAFNKVWTRTFPEKIILHRWLSDGGNYLSQQIFAWFTMPRVESEKKNCTDSWHKWNANYNCNLQWLSKFWRSM